MPAKLRLCLIGILPAGLAVLFVVWIFFLIVVISISWFFRKEENRLLREKSFRDCLPSICLVFPEGFNLGADSGRLLPTDSDL